MEKLMLDKKPDLPLDGLSASDPIPYCMVPGFELCKVEEVLAFMNLEKTYGTSSLYEKRIPCEDGKNVKPTDIPEYLDKVNEEGIPHPDAELYDKLPESLFRGIKILAKCKNREHQEKLILEWKERLFSEQSAEILTSPSGIDFIIRLTNSRKKMIEAWEENQMSTFQLDPAHVSPEGYLPISERDDGLRESLVDNYSYNDVKPTNDSAYAINRTILRKFLMDDKWINISPTIKKYQDELATIVDQLKKEGKKCVGCALNPYIAKLGQQLGQDFQNSSSISENEIANIKKELGVRVIKIIDLTSGKNNHVTR